MTTIPLQNEFGSKRPNEIKSISYFSNRASTVLSSHGYELFDINWTYMKIKKRSTPILRVAIMGTDR